MEKKKFDEYTRGISSLVRVYNESNSVVAAEKLKEDIVEVAESFVREYRGENIAEEKSEMPCNCAESPKTLQDIIDETKAKLTDNKTSAAIVFRAD